MFFLILTRLDVFTSFLQFFLVKKTRKKTNLFFIITFDRRHFQSIDFLQTLVKKDTIASERCQHMLKRRLVSHSWYWSHPNRQLNLINFNSQLKCENEWNFMSQTLQELLDQTYSNCLVLAMRAVQPGNPLVNENFNIAKSL